MEMQIDFEPFNVNQEIQDWIVNHRIHRDFDVNLNHRLTLKQLHDKFREDFPNSNNSLDFGSAQYLDELLCGNNQSGSYWRAAYGFPGEVGSSLYSVQLGSYIRIISSGIFTFNFERIDPPVQA